MSDLPPARVIGAAVAGGVIWWPAATNPIVSAIVAGGAVVAVAALAWPRDEPPHHTFELIPMDATSEAYIEGFADLIVRLDLASGR